MEGWGGGLDAIFPLTGGNISSNRGINAGLSNVFVNVALSQPCDLQRSPGPVLDQSWTGPWGAATNKTASLGVHK